MSKLAKLTLTTFAILGMVSFADDAFARRGGGAGSGGNYHRHHVHHHHPTRVHGQQMK